MKWTVVWVTAALPPMDAMAEKNTVASGMGLAMDFGARQNILPEEDG